MPVRWDEVRKKPGWKEFQDSIAENPGTQPTRPKRPARNGAMSKRRVNLNAELRPSPTRKP